MDNVIVNKVANSGLITINLEEFLPKEEIVQFDMKDHLFMGMILKEKDFREKCKGLNWEEYSNKNVAVVCSADAIIPVWAYMLVATWLQPVAKGVYLGSAEEMRKNILLKNIGSINIAQYADQRIVIKGCGDIPVDDAAYLEITKVLQPVVKSIMYGEPCSTVPVYKKK